MSAIPARAIDPLAFASGRASLTASFSFRTAGAIDHTSRLSGGLDDIARNYIGADPFHRPAYGTAMQDRDAVIKRAADIVLALAAILILSLPMLAVAVLIRLSSEGPVLFRQQRIGLNGCRFVMLKFRTMRNSPERPGVCPQATRHDPRVTRVGALLRRTSIDELPQLLNVLAGTMSLVGPRPHAPGTCAGGRPFEAITNRYAARHRVKPGMTGLAQIRGWRGETDTEEKLLRRVDCDLEYIANWNLLRDLLIIWRTTFTVLRMPNAY